MSDLLYLTKGVIPWWRPAYPPMAPTRAMTWADLWDAIFGARLEFWKVELDGSWYIADWATACAEMEGCSDDARPTVTRVLLTERQFEALPEFTGF